MGLWLSLGILLLPSLLVFVFVVVAFKKRGGQEKENQREREREIGSVKLYWLIEKQKNKKTKARPLPCEGSACTLIPTTVVLDRI